MAKKELLKEFEKKENEKKNNPGTAFFRSYYEGYGLKEVDSGDGLTRNEFVYKGMWYVFEGTPHKKALLKIIYSVLLLIAVGCLILCGFQQGEVTSSRVFAAPFFACALMAVIRFFSVIFYDMTSVKMQKHDYKRAVIRFKMFAVVAGICGTAGVIVNVILMVVYGSFSPGGFISCAAFFVYAVVSWATWFIEKKQQYRTIFPEDD